jgi:Na+/H+ antiporter NhaD/arsenite permease-like protein
MPTASNGAPPWVAVLIFLAAYIVITAPKLRLLPLGRPAGALVGAFAMVLAGVLTPEEAWTAIEPNTIVLLLGMMIVTAYLDTAGFFEWTAEKVIRRCGGPVPLLHALIWASGLLSAFLVNDTVCLLLTPLVLLSARRAGYPLLPYLFGLCMGANVGSVATLSGNPQNMLIGALSGDRYRVFLLHLAPVAIGGLAILSGILHLFFAHGLRSAAAARPAPAREPRLRLGLLRWTLIVLLGVVIAFLAGARLSFAALAGACALLVSARVPPRHLFARVDWTLLLFFAGLFVLVEGVVRAGAAGWMYDAFRPYLGETARRQAVVFTGLAVLGSNIVSNVPFILVAKPWIGTLENPLLQWRALAMATTFAGNLTLLGSVANLIVIEAAGKEVRVGFWTYFKIGVPVTIATTLWGLLVLLLLGA